MELLYKSAETIGVISAFLLVFALKTMNVSMFLAFPLSLLGGFLTTFTIQRQLKEL